MHLPTMAVAVLQIHLIHAVSVNRIKTTFKNLVGDDLLILLYPSLDFSLAYFLFDGKIDFFSEHLLTTIFSYAYKFCTDVCVTAKNCVWYV
jgi:hypothetical protein